MNWNQNRLALLVSGLFVCSSILFGVGTAIEHSQRDSHHETTAEVAIEQHPEGETAGETSPDTPAATVGSAQTHSERIAGVDPESWPLAGGVIAVSLLVAAGVYLRRGRWFVAAAALGVILAAADTRELVHQVQESRTAVAVIAAILIALHVVAAAGAAAASKARRKA